MTSFFILPIVCRNRHNIIFYSAYSLQNRHNIILILPISLQKQAYGSVLILTIFKKTIMEKRMKNTTTEQKSLKNITTIENITAMGKTRMKKIAAKITTTASVFFGIVFFDDMLNSPRRTNRTRSRQESGQELGQIRDLGPQDKNQDKFQDKNQDKNQVVVRTRIRTLIRSRIRTRIRTESQVGQELAVTVQDCY